MAPGRANVFTIPPGARFLDVLVEALVSGRLVAGFRPADDPLALADATIFLPTRRAARALEAAFRARSPGGAAVLPRIAPLGDVEDDDEADEVPAGDAGSAAALPPAIGLLDRQFELAGLIGAWSARLREAVLAPRPWDPPLAPSAPADILALADELARLIDSVETEEVAWERFRGLVPQDFDKAWQVTAEFLAIAAEAWPPHLAERGLSDPAWRRSRSLRALAAGMAATPPQWA